MPYELECPGCHARVTTDCTCPPQYRDAPFHIPACPMSDPDAQLNCDPDGPCCLQDHHHGQRANACPCGHGECRSGGTACTTVTPEGEPCPGGHCSLEDDGCHVCRPIIIRALAGTATVQPVPAGGA